MWNKKKKKIAAKLHSWNSLEKVDLYSCPPRAGGVKSDNMARALFEMCFKL